MQEENTWETYKNVTEHDMKLIEDYYNRNAAIERDRRFGKQTKKKMVRKRTKGYKRS
jgi:hypothetical protein